MKNTEINTRIAEHFDYLYDLTERFSDSRYWDDDAIEEAAEKMGAGIDETIEIMKVVCDASIYANAAAVKSADTGAAALASSIRDRRHLDDGQTNAIYNDIWNAIHTGAYRELVKLLAKAE